MPAVGLRVLYSAPPVCVAESAGGRGSFLVGSVEMDL